jgi:NAD(P)-dependent dehydrogenase (short-subunit alcohol dehydrogenase family)
VAIPFVHLKLQPVRELTEHVLSQFGCGHAPTSPGAGSILRERPPRVLISGAAHGAGRLCAQSLAERGIDLLLCDHDGSELQALCNLLGCAGRYCDVMSEASVSILAAQLDDQLSHLDALINLAGTGYVRALGMWRMSRALLPILKRGDGEKLIVNVASTTTTAMGEHDFPYASSDEAFAGLSNALLHSMRGSSVRARTLAPSSGPNANHFPTPTQVAWQVTSIVTSELGFQHPQPLLDERKAS